MSSSEPPSEETIAQRQADYLRFKHYAAITFLFAGPILIALPPRKLDHLTVIQFSAFCMSANYLVRERTGKGFFGHIASPLSASTQELPSERAQAIQTQLRAARDAQIRDGNVVGDELEKLQTRQNQEKGFAERIWMGNETAGWKERRIQEEQKALAEGKGYGDLITEYIRDVWPWGEKDQGESDKPRPNDGSQ